MKKILILFIAFFTTFTMDAQIEWVGDFGFSSRTNGLYKTQNNQFVVARVGQDDSGFSVLDSTGNLIFNYSDPYHLNPDPVEGQGHVRRIEDFIEMADSTYLFIFTEEFCGLPNNYNAHYRLIKFDQNWNELDINDPIFEVPPNTGFGYHFLAPLPDSTFIWLSYQFPFTEFQRRDRNGNIILSKILPYHLQGSIRDFLPLSGDTTALISWDSVHFINGQGDFVHSFKSPTFDNVKQASNGNYYGQKDDTVFVLTPAFSVIGHVSFPDTIIDNLTYRDWVRDFALTDSALVVLTWSNKIYIYDDSLHLQNKLYMNGEYPFGPPFLLSSQVAWLEALSGSFLVAGITNYGGDMGSNRKTSPPW